MSHRETICACSVARVVLKRLRWGDTRGKPRGWSRCQISSTNLKKKKSSPPPGSFRPARLISHHHSLSKEGEQLKLKDGKEMSKKRKLATSAASVQTSPLVSRARAPPHFGHTITRRRVHIASVMDLQQQVRRAGKAVVSSPRTIRGRCVGLGLGQYKSSPESKILTLEGKNNNFGELEGGGGEGPRRAGCRRMKEFERRRVRCRLLRCPPSSALFDAPPRERSTHCTAMFVVTRHETTKKKKALCMEENWWLFLWKL